MKDSELLKEAAEKAELLKDEKGEKGKRARFILRMHRRFVALEKREARLDAQIKELLKSGTQKKGR